MKTLLPALARPLLEPHLPPGLDLHWFTTRAEAEAAIVDADIAWVDMQSPQDSAEVAALGARLRWLSTMRAGIDAYDTTLLRERGTVMTNGTGLNPVAVAEYALLGMLAAAKRYDEVVRMADRHDWPTVAPGTVELAGTSALIIGYGTIGRLIGNRLAAFGVAVTGVTRSGRDGTLTPDGWKPRIADYEWIILAAPSTGETAALLGAPEFAAMKRSAWVINMARGDMIDQPALIEALTEHQIAGAFLDTVDPEPLPADHPLWSAPNALHSMHLSGRSQTTMFTRAATLFLENLAAFMAGEPMRNVVDLEAGY
ncbi:D-2-hydroxyacid dehydrogenase [Sphingomonas qomolangmaensis]|uniref:D-2-hydroxyacid dehydrogenase n=1 Tax=Sphingomonas qomolangmaensis TaxID=2918765 RepID=A0ABY5LB61_9SPHN|nr:D-2-hydroxyacid dehydrogenase [Sphingomonas qomolangmaensis]UUL83186.1 D-2-hydroxyacid dehydrogenase [Sphingomonas qomolangmaensis]